VKEIAKEKVSILEGLEENGLGVVNSDFEILDEALSLYSSSKLITFGESIKADWRLSDIKFSDTSMICSVTSNINNFDFKINTLGKHHAINAVAALCAIHATGADLSGTIFALKNWKPFKGRGERSLIKWKLYTDQSDLELIDESYNSSPASVEASLRTLAISKPPATHGRRVAILGDMLELGQTKKTLHEEISKYPSLKDINVVHCVGELMGSLFQNLPIGKRGLLTATAEDFLVPLAVVLKPGDLVMVKGSLSMRMNLIVDAIKKLGQIVEIIDEENF
jgi:UDP-N-acetylmuramoyl-tripeptide--D-alanyl-D-alanine ligase